MSLCCPARPPADVLPLFGQQTGWLLERLGLSARLDPVLGIHLCCTAVLHFLRQGGRGRRDKHRPCQQPHSDLFLVGGLWALHRGSSAWPHLPPPACPHPPLPARSLHLPLSEAQRAAQNWEPAKGHSALDRIKARDAADAAGCAPEPAQRGPLSW